MDEDEEDDEYGVDEDDEEGVDEDDEDNEEGLDEDDEDVEEGLDEDDEDGEEGVDEDGDEGDDEDEEETAILESIQDEAYVESNRRFLWEEQAKTDVLFDELDAEQEAEVNDVDVRMEIVDISDDGE
nr:acidic leucine-rich nuclear phosphoprotein 32 family member B-like [Aegilops tauschii subsp. strangulata]